MVSELRTIPGQPVLCAWCREATMIWGRTLRTQRALPLDVLENPLGNVAVLESAKGGTPSCRVLRKGELPVEGEILTTSHFATCRSPKARRRRTEA